MDVLSEILSSVRAERAMTARFGLTAPWGLASRGVHSVLIRMSRGAPYWLKVEGYAPLHVKPGELVVLLPDVAHTISSEPDGEIVPFMQVFEKSSIKFVGEPIVIDHGNGGDATDLFCVLLWLPTYCRNTVLGVLPPFVHVRESDRSIDSSLTTTMQSLVVESFAQRPGWQLSAVRLGELLLVNILSEHFAKEEAKGEGWLRGLVDPQIVRALSCIHKEPERDWTVDALANEAAMSRSRFSARFKELMGVTPFTYVSNRRMLRAALLIETGVRSVKQLAQATGYDSEKSFIRVFSQWCGVTPSVYMRRNYPHGSGGPDSLSKQ